MKNIQNRDFAELYQKFGPMVLRRCRFILKDEEKALDAMQDTFIRIIENQKQIENFCSSLFYVTATRICLNKIKADKIRSGPDFDSISFIAADESSENESNKIESKAVLDSIFDQLDFQLKLIATLHYIDGLTLEETANQTGLSVSTIRRRIAYLQEYAMRHKF